MLSAFARKSKAAKPACTRSDEMPASETNNHCAQSASLGSRVRQTTKKRSTSLVPLSFLTPHLRPTKQLSAGTSSAASATTSARLVVSEGRAGSAAPEPSVGRIGNCTSLNRRQLISPTVTFQSHLPTRVWQASPSPSPPDASRQLAQVRMSSTSDLAPREQLEVGMCRQDQTWATGHIEAVSRLLRHRPRGRRRRQSSRAVGGQSIKDRDNRSTTTESFWSDGLESSEDTSPSSYAQSRGESSLSVGTSSLLSPDNSTTTTTSSSSSSSSSSRSESENALSLSRASLTSSSSSTSSSCTGSSVDVNVSAYRLATKADLTEGSAVDRSRRCRHEQNAGSESGSNSSLDASCMDSSAGMKRSVEAKSDLLPTCGLEVSEQEAVVSLARPVHIRRYSRGRQHRQRRRVVTATEPGYPALTGKLESGLPGGEADALSSSNSSSEDSKDDLHDWKQVKKRMSQASVSGNQAGPPDSSGPGLSSAAGGPFWQTRSMQLPPMAWIHQDSAQAQDPLLLHVPAVLPSLRLVPGAPHLLDQYPYSCRLTRKPDDHSVSSGPSSQYQFSRRGNKLCHEMVRQPLCLQSSPAVWTTDLGTTATMAESVARLQPHQAGAKVPGSSAVIALVTRDFVPSLDWRERYHVLGVRRGDHVCVLSQPQPASPAPCSRRPASGGEDTRLGLEGESTCLGTMQTGCEKMIGQSWLFVRRWCLDHLVATGPAGFVPSQICRIMPQAEVSLLLQRGVGFRSVNLATASSRPYPRETEKVGENYRDSLASSNNSNTSSEKQATSQAGSEFSDPSSSAFNSTKHSLAAVQEPAPLCLSGVHMPPSMLQMVPVPGGSGDAGDEVKSEQNSGKIFCRNLVCSTNVRTSPSSPELGAPTSAGLTSHPSTSNVAQVTECAQTDQDNLGTPSNISGVLEASLLGGLSSLIQNPLTLAPTVSGRTPGSALPVGTATSLPAQMAFSSGGSLGSEAEDRDSGRGPSSGSEWGSGRGGSLTGALDLQMDEKLVISSTSRSYQPQVQPQILQPAEQIKSVLLPPVPLQSSAYMTHLPINRRIYHPVEEITNASGCPSDCSILRPDSSVYYPPSGHHLLRETFAGPISSQCPVTAATLSPTIPPQTGSIRLSSTPPAPPTGPHLFSLPPLPLCAGSFPHESLESPSSSLPGGVARFQTITGESESTPRSQLEQHHVLSSRRMRSPILNFSSGKTSSTGVTSISSDLSTASLDIEPPQTTEVQYPSIAQATLLGSLYVRPIEAQDTRVNHNETINDKLLATNSSKSRLVECSKPQQAKDNVDGKENGARRDKAEPTNDRGDETPPTLVPPDSNPALWEPYKTMLQVGQYSLEKFTLV